MIGSDPFLVVFFALYFVVFLKTLLFHTYLWQNKEYLPLRLFNELITPQGQKYSLPPQTITKIFLLIFYPLFPNLRLIFTLSIIAIFIYDFFLSICSFLNKTFKKPKNFTLKIVIIAFLSIISSIFILFILIFLKTSILYALLFIERTILFLVFIFVLIAKIPTKITKKIIIYQAKQKLKKFKNLKIIGITGSFGKTSVKEFTAQILGSKFQVLKTPKNINTDIGVAELILKELKPHHQIFVVEMGAYKKGEIKDICKIAPPDISILTAISEQHQESFKSLENTIATKSEIFEYQKKGGLAIINDDNYYCVQIAQRLKQKKILYSTNNKADLYAQNIKVFPTGFLFALLIDGQKITIESKLLGHHNVSNLLPAITVAQKFGLTLDEIKNQINKIAPIEKTMRIIPGIKKSILIDDSYNANPDGIIAALKYLQSYSSRKKIIVSSGMYELGQSAKKLHLKIGEAIGKICDLAIFTNINYKEELIKGFTKFKPKKFIIFEDNFKKASEILKKNLDNQPVILFESRTTDLILKDLKA